MKLYSILSMSLLFSILFSCGDIKDTYEEFVKGGEIIYVAKADSLKARGGNERIELSWLLLSDPKVTHYTIYWNDNLDSISGTLFKTTEVDTIRVILDNMREDVFYFDVVQFDTYRNHSIKSSVAGRIYGENYRSTLLNKAFRNIKFNEQDVEIEWSTSSSSSEMIFIEVEYWDTNNKLIRRVLPPSSQKDTLYNISLDGFRYRTAFLPEELAIDTFYCDYSPYYIE